MYKVFREKSVIKSLSDYKANYRESLLLNVLKVYLGSKVSAALFGQRGMTHVDVPLYGKS